MGISYSSPQLGGALEPYFAYATSGYAATGVAFATGDTRSFGFLGSFTASAQSVQSTSLSLVYTGAEDSQVTTVPCSVDVFGTTTVVESLFHTFPQYSFWTTLTTYTEVLETQTTVPGTAPGEVSTVLTYRTTTVTTSAPDQSITGTSISTSTFSNTVTVGSLLCPVANTLLGTGTMLLVAPSMQPYMNYIIFVGTPTAPRFNLTYVQTTVPGTRVVTVPSVVITRTASQATPSTTTVTVFSTTFAPGCATASSGVAVPPTSSAAESQLTAAPSSTESQSGADASAAESVPPFSSANSSLSVPTAAPLPSGSVPLPSQNFAIAIQPPSNQKRQTGGSYVSSSGESTSNCSQGSLWSGLNGQLLYAGMVISTNPGNTYQPLPGIAQNGSISTTFRLLNNELVWVNSAFMNNKAQFCQDSAGQVYAKFTNSSLGFDCSPVVLGVVTRESGMRSPFVWSGLGFDSRSEHFFVWAGSSNERGLLDNNEELDLWRNDLTANSYMKTFYLWPWAI
ncbi:hypothetical protein GQ53DRAFT_824930 [Thozetella sp. PMI_491]|nr:hypothetical protein GQ53DRAFT_824930 [Thozetella sp. PMI_491]